MKQNAAKMEFEKADWKSVGLRLLVFARYWAKAHYGWYECKLLAGGNTPEDVASEVYAAYRRGDRKFNDADPMWIQLKRSVKSILWNLHASKENKCTSSEDSEFFEPISDEKPGPEAALRTAEFQEHLFQILYADPRVRKSDHLRKTIEAFENGAREIAELVKDTGLSTARIYEMRRQLKPVVVSALNKINRDGEVHE